MSHQGAALQNYNNELVKCFEELCKRREDLQRQIQQDETERAKLQREINVLNDKLTRVNESLEKKLSTRNEYDRTIAESEAAYMKFSDSFNCPKKGRSKYCPKGNGEKCSVL
ncbi:unnamed protein product, partial [Schistosoma intercalatum]